MSVKNGDLITGKGIEVPRLGKTCTYTKRITGIDGRKPRGNYDAFIGFEIQTYRIELPMYPILVLSEGLWDKEADDNFEGNSGVHVVGLYWISDKGCDRIFCKVYVWKDEKIRLDVWDKLKFLIEERLPELENFDIRLRVSRRPLSSMESIKGEIIELLMVNGFDVDIRDINYCGEIKK